MELISWLHGDKLREEWDKIVRLFEIGESLLKSMEVSGIGALMNAMYSALNLKLYSLGIGWTPQTDLSSKIERLVEAGIDARSLAWGDLAAMRGYDAHARPVSRADLNNLRRHLNELREVLFKLQPIFGPVAS